MYYKARKELTIVELKGNEENLFFNELTEIILRKPSNIIYCERNEKLHGIISMGDIARASGEGADCVAVNTRFICILHGEHMRARKIFYDKVNIHELPVVNEDNVLLGAYSCWDDLLVNQCITHMSGEGGKIGRYGNIAFVRPREIFEEKQKIFQECLQYIKLKGVKAEVIELEEISDYIEQTEQILFLDEDEWRAIDTLWLWILHKNFNRRKFITWKKYIEYEDMEAHLNRIQKEGVHVFNLCFQDSEHYLMLRKDISARYAALGVRISNKLLPAMYKNFFADLYTEEYAYSITHLHFSVESKSGCGKLKDADSQFYHVVNGERYTVGQPEKYKKAIYFVGPCFIYGHYVEDKNTIESILQRRIDDEQYDIKVVNCGSPRYTGSFHVDLMWARLSEIPLKKGDIVIVYVANKFFHNITEIDLMSVLLEKNDINVDWIIDKPEHCNHKMNGLYAEAIYDKLEHFFDEVIDGQGKMIDNNTDFVKDIYIDKYFKNIDFSKYEKVGSIVMNCNPFTNGHRYLIEQALQKVDFLIIFVVEEDRSIFSFAERFAMVSDGIENLDNVMAVPSGPFILTKTTFPEYFIKAEDGELVENVENDIRLFAERIAPHLNIKCRFV
ncbi:MAG: adenylyltransferase/cytidyltransferase family protein, partial [Lachnospiraceae bacterium]|nr:adenylyltransferase/cytidyltransferase family protein [Lachnospiraceae bacterium]